MPPKASSVLASSVLTLPDSTTQLEHVISALSCYWPKDNSAIYQLPIRLSARVPDINLPLSLLPIELPSWANTSAVNGIVLVPIEAVPSNVQHGPHTWQSVDWVLAAFLLLEGWHERLWEQRYGPIHSYSLMLTGWDERVWDHAWVNRIGLFLREWAIITAGSRVEYELGPLPEPTIQITHDVDALDKTIPIRLKQGLFNLYKSLRALRHLNFSLAFRDVIQAARFFFSQDDWWTVDDLLSIESSARVLSVWNFYAESDVFSLKKNGCLTQVIRSTLKNTGFYLRSSSDTDTL